MSQKFLSNIELNAGLVDANDAAGTSGQVLSSTGTGVEWIDQAAITGAESNKTYYEVKNSSGATILKGKGVMAVGTDGNSGHILIDEMVADGTVEPRYFMGILEDSLDNGEIGTVIAFGELDQFNTSGQNGETWTDGQILWCDPDSAGDFTTTQPTAPAVKIPAAFILKASTQGKIQIRVQANEGLHELHDTHITTQSDGEILVWDNTNEYWFNDGTLTVDYTNGNVGIVGNLTAQAISGTTGTFSDNITNDGNIVSQGNITSVGTLQSHGFVYTRDNLLVLNAAETGWNTWATRSATTGKYALTADSIDIDQLDLRGESIASDDLDAVSRGLHYWGSSQPTTGSTGYNYMNVLTTTDPNQNIQLAWGGSTNGKLFVRRADSGTYYDWTEFWSDSHFTSTDISNWDTVYNAYNNGDFDLDYVTDNGAITTNDITVGILKSSRTLPKLQFDETDTTNNNIELRVNGGNFIIDKIDDNFSTNRVERFRIDDTGLTTVSANSGAAQGTVLKLDNTGDYGSAQDLHIYSAYDRDVGIKLETLGGVSHIYQDSNGDDALIFATGSYDRTNNAGLTISQSQDVSIPNGYLGVNGASTSAYPLNVTGSINTDTDYRIDGVQVFDTSRNLVAVGGTFSSNVDLNGNLDVQGKVGIGIDASSAYALNIQYDQTNPNADYYFAQRIDANFSGADNTTADREQGGIFIDIDSSADGDASNEHRLYGVYSDVRFTGFTDSSVSIYGKVENNNSTEIVNNMYGLSGAVYNDCGASGGVSGAYGAQGYVLVQDAGSAPLSIGVSGFVNVYSDRTVNVGDVKAAKFEVQIDSPNAITYGNVIGVESIIDNNEGTVPTGTNSYLFKGDYQGTRHATNSWGLYVQGDKHYLENKLSVGTTYTTNTLNVGGTTNILSGDLKIGGTTVIDSSRNISAVNGSFSGNLGQGVIFTESGTYEVGISNGTGGQLWLTTEDGSATAHQQVRRFVITGNTATPYYYWYHGNVGAETVKMELNTSGDLDIKAGDILLADGQGIVSASGAEIKTGSGGNTFQAKAGASNAGGFIVNNSAGVAQFVADQSGDGWSYFAGKLAIGQTSEPSETLKVAGDAWVTGGLTVSGILSLNTGDSLSFEGGNHWITYNDGGGNFNIRVGHYDNASGIEETTEAGYVFQDEWSQSGGWREFNVSNISTTVGQLEGTNWNWRTQIEYNYEQVFLRYQGNTRVSTTAAGASINGDLQVLGSLKVQDDSDAASSSNVGSLRYRADSNNSYVDMCMQTGATTYEWVNIVQNNW